MKGNAEDLPCFEKRRNTSVEERISQNPTKPILIQGVKHEIKRSNPKKLSWLQR